MYATDAQVANRELFSNVSPMLPSRFIDSKKLQSLSQEHKERYRTAKPFPHTVIDNFFPPHMLDAVIADLPPDNNSWTHYDNPNERKRVFSNVEGFGPAAETFAYALNSLAFIQFLQNLTGIEGIIADPYLHAAGYMKVEPGGFLNLHKDFTMHKSLPLERRINVLVYLNHDWQPEWGGQLELHSNDDLNNPKHLQIDVEPIFNRMVIFSTPNALHGHRRPVACPPSRARLLFSCFYFTVPPILGYRSRIQKVDFGGQNNFARKAIQLANRLVPPILFDLASGRRRSD